MTPEFFDNDDRINRLNEFNYRKNLGILFCVGPYLFSVAFIMFILGNLITFEKSIRNNKSTTDFILEISDNAEVLCVLLLIILTAWLTCFMFLNAKRIIK